MAILLLYSPIILNAALCMNLIEPIRGTMVDIAGMILPCEARSIDRASSVVAYPRPSTIILERSGKATSRGMLHPPKRRYFRRSLNSLL